jgi:hypothetical protein
MALYGSFGDNGLFLWTIFHGEYGFPPRLGCFSHPQRSQEASAAEYFCMTKIMFKHFFEHILPFSWVYLIPTYVRQLPPPLRREIHSSTWTPPLIHQRHPHH